VLAEQFYPGWVVEANGQPTQIVRTHHVMRGVRLPAGEHRLVYRYRPAAFYWGAGVSLCGWTMLLVVALAVASRRMRSASPK
jgi:uncharacterized membrane protein YfhO